MSSQQVVFVAYALVYNTDLIKTAKFSQDDFKEVLIQTQQALDMWSGMIWATGGALIPKKTFWCAIDISWNKGQCEYTSITDLPTNLEMKDPLGQVQTVARLEPSNT